MLDTIDESEAYSCIVEMSLCLDEVFMERLLEKRGCLGVLRP